MPRIAPSKFRRHTGLITLWRPASDICLSQRVAGKSPARPTGYVIAGAGKTAIDVSLGLGTRRKILIAFAGLFRVIFGSWMRATCSQGKNFS